MDAIKSCPICGATQERKVDGHLVHAPYTEATWAFHYRAHEEEVMKSLRERAMRGGEPPALNPPLGGYYS